VLPFPSDPTVNRGVGFTAPFVFNGRVTGFARDDLDGRTPLFDLTVVGQGTVGLGFDDFSNRLYSVVDERFTFGATPEPAPLMLLGTGLFGWIARTWTRRRVV
jgi:hypothetical protein